jgi:predicted nuclease of predicted toxin-antitoxin system
LSTHATKGKSDSVNTLKFYADSHIAEAVAVQLRQNGIDIVRCQEVGLDDASDEEHLEYAVQEERAIITKDEDYLRHHNEWTAVQRDHFGIFYCPDRNVSAIGRIVTVCSEFHQLIENAAGTVEDDIMNQVIYIR